MLPRAPAPLSPSSESSSELTAADPPRTPQGPGLAALEAEEMANKYQAGRTGAEIAKLIRGEIKTACKTDGPLHGCKVSVRYRSATHRMAIDIEITETPASILNHERVLAVAANNIEAWRLPRYTAQGEAMLAAAKRIADAFNRFDSDIQTDYNNDLFFCSVTFNYDLTQRQEAAILCPVASHPACCGCADCEERYAA